MTLQFYALRKQAGQFLAKHHVVLFLSLIGLILAIAIYMMYQVVQTTFAPPVVTSSTIVGFDQKTIDQIKDLHDSSSDTTIQLPSPRPNPFAE